MPTRPYSVVPGRLYSGALDGPGSKTIGPELTQKMRWQKDIYVQSHIPINRNMHAYTIDTATRHDMCRFDQPSPPPPPMVYTNCIGFRSKKFWPKVLAESFDRVLTESFGFLLLAANTCPCTIGIYSFLEGLGFKVKGFRVLGFRVYICVYIYIYGCYYESLICYFRGRFLISFASFRIFDEMFEVLANLVQSNPSLDQKEVWYIMCIDLVRCSVSTSFASESDLWTPKYDTLKSTLLLMY